MTSAGTTRRSVRIDDTLWAQASKAAEGRGESVSDVIRRALEVYTGTDMVVSVVSASERARLQGLVRQARATTRDLVRERNSEHQAADDAAYEAVVLALENLP